MKISPAWTPQERLEVVNWIGLQMMLFPNPLEFERMAEIICMIASRSATILEANRVEIFKRAGMKDIDRDPSV